MFLCGTNVQSWSSVSEQKKLRNIVSISEERLKKKREEIREKMMDVEGVEDDGDAIIKFIATKTERLVFTWPIRYYGFTSFTIPSRVGPIVPLLLDLFW